MQSSVHSSFSTFNFILSPVKHISLQLLLYPSKNDERAETLSISKQKIKSLLTELKKCCGSLAFDESKFCKFKEINELHP